jgi:glucosamine-6-phosphate deaminase
MFMQVIILPTPNDVAQYAANSVVDVVTENTNSILGLATGSTPIALYDELVSRCRAGLLSFKNTKTFNLDEYIGISECHEQSYRAFMNRHLFNLVDINPANTYVPLADSLDPEVLACNAKAYESEIERLGGIDLQILGIGVNGHIGFNEPTSSFASRTRIKTLSKSTVEANKRFFTKGEFQPHLAITMGIGTILESRAILLMATGKGKAQAVKDMIEGPLTSMCPASVLQQHKKSIVILDEEAASLLSLKEYYLWCEEKRQQLHEGNLL